MKRTIKSITSVFLKKTLLICKISSLKNIDDRFSGSFLIKVTLMYHNEVKCDQKWSIELFQSSIVRISFKLVICIFSKLRDNELSMYTRVIAEVIFLC